METPPQSELDAAIERYRRAQRELVAASEALRGLLIRSEAEACGGHTAVAIVQRCVADFYSLDASDMLATSRPNHIAHPRQIAMSLVREFTPLSLQEIGYAFGGRDHGTVIHAIKAVADRLDSESDFRAELDRVRERVRAWVAAATAAPAPHA